MNRVGKIASLTGSLALATAGIAFQANANQTAQAQACSQEGGCLLPLKGAAPVQEVVEESGGFPILAVLAAVASIGAIVAIVAGDDDDDPVSI
jgi:hypothetical protein